MSDNPLRDAIAAKTARTYPGWEVDPESEITVPPYLMIDGHGDPNTSPDYAAAVEALYTVAYTIRFALKRGPAGVDAGPLPAAPTSASTSGSLRQRSPRGWSGR